MYESPIVGKFCFDFLLYTYIHVKYVHINIYRNNTILYVSIMYTKAINVSLSQCQEIYRL